MTPITLSAENDNLPAQLAHHELSPKQLFIAGDPSILEKPALAIVGSRDSTTQAMVLAERLAAKAAEAGLVIVSGGARGIDSAAHEGAMMAGGLTICVLGRPLEASGASHQTQLPQRIIANGGAVISELAEGTPYWPRQFTDRNRLIAGLGLAVLVVQAKLQSGALSTAAWAKKWPRQLWVVPGAPWDERAQGVNQLLAQGAVPVSDEHVLDLVIKERLGISERPDEQSRRRTRDPVLRRLERSPASAEELAREFTFEWHELSAKLLQLELAGDIRRVAGTYRAERGRGKRVAK